MLAFLWNDASGRVAFASDSEPVRSIPRRLQVFGCVLAGDVGRGCVGGGIWVRAFNAKKQAADGGGPQLDALSSDIAVRLRHLAV